MIEVEIHYLENLKILEKDPQTIESYLKTSFLHLFFGAIII